MGAVGWSWWEIDGVGVGLRWFLRIGWPGPCLSFGWGWSRPFTCTITYMRILYLLWFTYCIQYTYILLLYTLIIMCFSSCTFRMSFFHWRLKSTVLFEHAIDKLAITLSILSISCTTPRKTPPKNVMTSQADRSGINLLQAKESKGSWATFGACGKAYLDFRSSRWPGLCWQRDWQSDKVAACVRTEYTGTWWQWIVFLCSFHERM